MEDKICEERHQYLNEKLENHTRRLDRHGKRLDDLEQYRAGVEQRIDNLCEKIDGLIVSMRWFVGLLIGSFVGFFFYAAQKGLIK